MDTQTLKAAWRAKNARTEKAVAVEIDGVGKMYVRLLHVADADAISELAKAGDGDAYATVMAGLLCDEHGKRLSPEERAEWAQIFAGATWEDYLALSGAARGNAQGNAAGN
jgi:hypothetical protein